MTRISKRSTRTRGSIAINQQHDQPYRWAATQSVASKIACTPETLRIWVKKMEINAGTKPGVAIEQYLRTKELEREVRELKRANEILRRAFPGMVSTT